MMANVARRRRLAAHARDGHDTRSAVYPALRGLRGTIFHENEATFYRAGHGSIKPGGTAIVVTRSCCI